ncbi:hypothetical protein AX15_003924 [Amanita polypyramis BW_CC]|nr:hypothetical protein AX15_003924 [Amanita polypyramis BW_CC]
MSAPSGIPLSDDLHVRLAATNPATRFLKIVIRNETLVHDLSVLAQGSFEADLLMLQDSQVLQDNAPAYILARLEPPSQWLAIFYVPDSAKIRDKMLYASTRNSLLKVFGSTIIDSLFATSKDDLTPDAYAAHKRHNEAPKPLSSREQELADIRAAENSSLSYQGTRGRTSHVDGAVGFRWSEDAETAIISLSRGEGCAIVILQVDPATEALTLSSFKDIDIENIGEVIPPSEPCYAFLAWPHSLSTPPRREIVYIYSCPTTSPVKYRMLYTCGFLSTFRAGSNLIQASTPMAYIASRRIEISDPKDLNEETLRAGLRMDEERIDTVGDVKDSEPKSFSRPKKPARRS